MGNLMIAEAKNGWRKESAILALRTLFTTSAGDELGMGFHKDLVGFLATEG